MLYVGLDVHKDFCWLKFEAINSHRPVETTSPSTVRPLKPFPTKDDLQNRKSWQFASTHSSLVPTTIRTSS